MPITAIVLAAGEGTRMKSRHTKVMHKLLDRPLVGWTVRSAQGAADERILRQGDLVISTARALTDGMIFPDN